MNSLNINKRQISKMKQGILFLTLLFTFVSCTKDEEPIKNYDSIDIELSKNELFTYDTKNSGDEEGGKIIEQAQHFMISEIVRDSVFRLVYRYQPKEDYVGEDNVQIELSSGSDGASPSTHFDYITINFTIK